MYLDYKHVASQVTCLQVLQMLGIEAKADTKGHRAPCSACGDDERGRKIQVFSDTGRFKCYGGEGKGDAIDLLLHLKNMTSKRNAAKELVEHFDLTPSPSTVPSKPPVKTVGFDRDAYQAKLLREHKLLTEAGVTPEMARRYDLGVSPKGAHQGMLVVPLYEGGTFAEYVGVTGFHFIKRRS